MIGSHDSFTYLKSTSWLYNNSKKLWKCQKDSVFDQYKFGVRMFDIRVEWDKGKWRLCHGKVNLKMTFGSLEMICAWMRANCPEAIYHIVLEKGSSSDELRFCQQSQGLCKRYKNLWRLDIKASKNWMGAVDNNNQSLYNRGYKFALVNRWDEPLAHELHGFLKSNNFYKIDLRKEAQKINGKLDFFKSSAKLNAMINSKDELYLLDYCTNKY